MLRCSNFRSCLLQVGQDAKAAFTAAHGNTRQLGLLMAQVPTHLQRAVAHLINAERGTGASNAIQEPLDCARQGSVNLVGLEIPYIELDITSCLVLLLTTI